MARQNSQATYRSSRPLVTYTTWNWPCSEGAQGRKSPLTPHEERLYAVSSSRGEKTRTKDRHITLSTPLLSRKSKRNMRARSQRCACAACPGACSLGETRPGALTCTDRAVPVGMVRHRGQAPTQSRTLPCRSVLDKISRHQRLNTFTGDTTGFCCVKILSGREDGTETLFPLEPASGLPPYNGFDWI